MYVCPNHQYSKALEETILSSFNTRKCMHAWNGKMTHYKSKSKYTPAVQLIGQKEKKKKGKKTILVDVLQTIQRMRKKTPMKIAMGIPCSRKENRRKRKYREETKTFRFLFGWKFLQWASLFRAIILFRQLSHNPLQKTFIAENILAEVLDHTGSLSTEICDGLRNKILLITVYPCIIRVFVVCGGLRFWSLSF